MSIEYITAKRTRYFKEFKTKEYIAKPFLKERIDFKTLMKEWSIKTDIPEKKIKLLFTEIYNTITKEVPKGNYIVMGEIGRIFPDFKTYDIIEEKEDLKPEIIIPTLKFSPSLKLQKDLAKSDLEENQFNYRKT